MEMEVCWDLAARSIHIGYSPPDDHTILSFVPMADLDGHYKSNREKGV